MTKNEGFSKRTWHQYGTALLPYHQVDCPRTFIPRSSPSLGEPRRRRRQASTNQTHNGCFVLPTRSYFLLELQACFGFIDLKFTKEKACFED
jgi:hypothetical protein